jgi:serine phosphatase RsbU (regulator of sigma subunit)
VPGDLLVIFSDGVTEATAGDDEFGEERLIQALQAHRRLPVNDLVTVVLDSVQRFSAGSQWDDLTLVVARARE